MEKYRHKIEESAASMEQMGLSPVAARVYVYLLYNTSEKGATFDDLVAYFKVSKSAISNALKLLQQTGMVNYKTYGGKRRRYFYMDLSSFLDNQFMTARIKTFLNLLEDASKARLKDDEQNKRLKDLALFYKMALAEMPIILERWKNLITEEK